MAAAEQQQVVKHDFGNHIEIVELMLTGKHRVTHKPSGIWKLCHFAGAIGDTVAEIEKQAGLRVKQGKAKRVTASNARLRAMDGKPNAERMRQGAVTESTAAVDGEIVPVWRAGGRDWLLTAKSKGWINDKQHDAALEFEEIWTHVMNANSIRSTLDPHTILMKIIQGASTKNASGLNDGPLYFIGRMNRIHDKIGEAGVKFLTGVICDGTKPGDLVPMMTGTTTSGDNKIGLGMLRHLLNEVMT